MIVPPLVARARAAATQLGLDDSSDDEDGRLLHVLAARRGVARVAETRTGDGVRTACLASALAPRVPLFTAEPDPRRAAAARALFAADPDVHVLDGDWREVLVPEAPFELVRVACDHGDDLDAVLGIAAPGATLVLDDVPADGAVADARRALWLRDRRVVAVEVGTGGCARALVAVVGP